MPAVANGVLYFGGEDSCVYVRKASDGSLLWRVFASPRIVDGVLYFVSYDNCVCAFQL